MLGTDDKYRAYRKRVDAAKAALKNSTPAERDAVEKRMAAEMEAEGLRAEAEVVANADGHKTVKVQ